MPPRCHVDRCSECVETLALDAALRRGEALDVGEIYDGLRALRSDLIGVYHGRIGKRTSEGQPYRIPQRGRRRALRHRSAALTHLTY
jgi:hypothetical protein